MKYRIKKLLASVMAFLMAFQMIPVSAVADGLGINTVNNKQDANVLVNIQHADFNNITLGDNDYPDWMTYVIVGTPEAGYDKISFQEIKNLKDSGMFGFTVPNPDKYVSANLEIYVKKYNQNYYNYTDLLSNGDLIVSNVANGPTNGTIASSEGAYDVGLTKDESTSIYTLSVTPPKPGTITINYPSAADAAKANDYFLLLKRKVNDSTTAFSDGVAAYVIQLGGTKQTETIDIPKMWSDNGRYTDDWDVLFYVIKRKLVNGELKNITPGNNRPNWNDAETVENVGGLVMSYEKVGKDYVVTFEQGNFTTYPGAMTPDTFLGGGVQQVEGFSSNAVEFGVIAGTYVQNGHTETNFAVKTFTDGSNIDIGGAGSSAIPIYVGNITNKLWLSQNTNVNVDLICPPSQISKIEDTTNNKVRIFTENQEQINNYVDRLVDAAAAQSTTMKDTPPTFVLNSKQDIDTRNLPNDSTIYINCDDSVTSTSGWHIHKLPGQSIVFNVSGSNVTVNKFHVTTYDPDTKTELKTVSTVTDATDYSGSGSTTNQLVDELIFSHIFFNAYEAGTLNLIETAGAFVAPNADINISGGASAGWVIGGKNNTVTSSSEWHFYRHTRNYHARAETGIKVQKSLVDDDTNAAVSNGVVFTFEMTELENDGRNNLVENSASTETAGGKAGQGILFPKIELTKEDFDFSSGEAGSHKTKNFYYVIRETIPDGAQSITLPSGEIVKYDSEDHILYSTEEIYLKVVGTYDPPASGSSQGTITFDIYKLKDNSNLNTLTSNGNHFKKIDPNSNVYDVGTFTNRYNGTEVSVNKVWNDNNDAQHTRPQNVTVTLKKDGTIYGTPVQLNKENNWSYTWANLDRKHLDGSYVEYSVEEADVENYTKSIVLTSDTNDHSHYVYTVTNTKIQNGSLKIRKTVTENGSTNLSEAAKSYLAGTYTFGVYIDQACTQAYQKDGNPVTVTITIGEDGAAQSSEEITDLPAATYYIKENGSLKNGVSAVQNPVAVTVVAGKTGEEAAIATITNNYVHTEGEVKVKKTFTGREWNNNDSFKFTIVPIGNAPAFSNNQLTITKLDADNGYTKSFGNVTFTDEGTYQYKVTEEHKGETIKGVSYDNDDKTVTIKVTKQNGVLVATSDSNLIQTAEFTNTYEADGETYIYVKKNLEGRSWQEGDDWTFTLTAADGTPMPEETVIHATSLNTSEFRFGPIAYDQDDIGATYTYTVTESGTVAGVTNDGTPAKTATVGVTYDAETHGLAVSNTTSDADRIVFTNTRDKGAMKITKQVTVNGGTVPDTELVDGTYTFNVIGQDIAEGHNRVVKIQIEKGAVSKAWIDKTEVTPDANGFVVVSDLPTGTYKITEEISEDNMTAKGITLTSNPDGFELTVTKEPTEIPSATFINDKDVTVKVSKVDVADGAELTGAHIQILRNATKDEDENVVYADEEKTLVVVEEWDSVTGQPHVAEDLQVGEKYTLRETVAPDGYTITSDTTFIIGKDGKVTSTCSQTTDDAGNTVLLVKDSKTHVEVSKVDVADGHELEGAHIQILRKLEEGEEMDEIHKEYTTVDGVEYEVVDKWRSRKDETHKVEGLLTNTEYVLHETVAPDGYTITSDTSFSIDENGKIVTTDTSTKDVKGQTVLLVEDAKTHVEISKVDVDGGEELDGAKIQILRKLEEDEEKDEIHKEYTTVDGVDYEVVDKWTSSKDETHKVEGLLTNTEYVLHETVAPTGYTITTDTTFSIDEKGNIDKKDTSTKDVNGKTVLLVEDAKTISINKVDAADSHEVDGAVIQILRKLEDGETQETGKKYTEINNEVYEVVDDWKSERGKTHQVEGLKVGVEYVLHELTAPYGYKLTTDTTFTIAKDGTVTGTATKEYDENGKETGVLLVKDDMILVSVTVKKIWKDDGNRDGVRPVVLKVNLLQNGKVYNKEDILLTESNSWSCMVKDLPMVDANQVDYKYTWEEVGLNTDDYPLTKMVEGKTLTTITNTHETEKTDVSVRKAWNDQKNAAKARPEEIRVQLFANGRAEGAAVTLNEANGWSYKWEKLNKNSGGKEIDYSVDEVEVPEGYTKDGCTKEVRENETSFMITNTLVPGKLEIEKKFDFIPVEPEEPDNTPVDIPVAKSWDDNGNEDGNRPASVTVRLLADGKEVASAQLNAENGWKATFTGMPRLNEAEEKIVYTVTEDPVAWYRAEIDGYNIRNVYVPETTSVTVRKVWDDNNNQAKLRPTSIYMTLSNGTTVLLNAENGWSATISDLPTKVNGQDVTYTWTEQAVVSYTNTGVTTEGNVTTFTNRLVPVPEVKKDTPKPKTPGNGWVVFEEYDTALGGEITINHVGDCFD